MLSAKSVRITPVNAIRRTVTVTMTSDDNKLKVVVTGAGGRTGGLVMKKLLERSNKFEAVGVVRSDKSAKQLLKLGVAKNNIFIGDIIDDTKVLENAFEGADRLVVCTSAVPQIMKRSLLPVILAKIVKKQGVRPKFRFKSGQMPEAVDWKSQKLQFNLAKAAGIEKCVVVGSMGGTQRDNFLNTIGNGNILIWKRRAERYLIDSGLNYTIIHPGGLKDDEGGSREIVIDVDDKLISSRYQYRSIPRADVAELCIQCLSMADRRAFDAVAKDIGDGEPTRDFAALLAAMSVNCDYSDMDDDEFVGNKVATAVQ